MVDFRCPSDTGPDTNPAYPYTKFSNDPTEFYATSNYVPSQIIAAYAADTEGSTSFRHIKDGTSNVLMMGERMLRLDPAEERFTGAVVFGRVRQNTDAATCFHPGWGINVGYAARDNHAWATTDGSPNGCRAHCASSNHPGGANFTFCDGSVHFLSETIASNPAAVVCVGGGSAYCGPGFVYQNLYHTSDGNPIGAYD